MNEEIKEILKRLEEIEKLLKQHQELRVSQPYQPIIIQQPPNTPTNPICSICYMPVGGGCPGMHVTCNNTNDIT